jgi:hypothetical protein
VARVRLDDRPPAGRVLVDTGMIDSRPEVDDMSPTPHPENIPRGVSEQVTPRRTRLRRCGLVLRLVAPERPIEHLS